MPIDERPRRHGSKCISMGENLYLGNYCKLNERNANHRFEVPAHHFTTHGVLSACWSKRRYAPACPS